MTMQTPADWSPQTAPIDYVLFQGQKTPGLADVEGAGSPRKWDERGGYALSGATVVFTGLGLAEFKVKIRLYSTKDWADWYAFKPLVDKPPIGRRPRALDVWHPFLEGHGIKSCVVLDVSQPERTDDTGEWTITIECKEFRRPKIQYSKPEASQATPGDPVDQYIEQLTGQVNALSAPPPPPGNR